MHHNKKHKYFKSYKLGIYIHITELIKCNNIMIIAVETGKNGEIKC